MPARKVVAKAEAPKPKAKAAPKAVPKVESKKGGRPSPLPGVFESREKEPIAFDIMNVRPTRNFATGLLVWTVPPEKVELFRAHFHVTSNRVIYKGRKEPEPQQPEEVEAEDEDAQT